MRSRAGLQPDDSLPDPNALMESLSPAELRRRMDAGEDLVLLDVREPGELAICRIAGSVHIPLGELPSRASELDPERATVCICHHGIRSAQAAGFLQASCDFELTFNLEGGVDRWAQEVDPGMRRY